MSKTIKNCFYKNLTFDKLLQAHKRARVHKTYKREVIKFELSLENNIYNLLNSIKNNKYHLGKYFSFKVYEPKERTISALPYVDRIVHQWYIEEFIKPYIIPKFINSTFACIENRGVHKAADYVQKQMQIFYHSSGENYWILKCDIRKFFYTIDPNILFEIMKKYIDDKLLLKFTYILIFNGRNDIGEIGIPIGNYTSQYFANIYLNELDQYVKHKLHIKSYCRYMDDFIFILHSKKECIEVYNKVKKFLADKLHLELNSKSKYYPAKMGVNFCGYRIFGTHRLLRNSSKKKIKANVKKWNKKFHKNNLDIEKTMLSLNSWLGHSSHCNSYKLQQKILNSCDFLYNQKFAEETYNKLIELNNKN